MRQSTIFHLALPLCAFAGLSCGTLAWSDEFAPGTKVGVVRSPLVREASGIVASRKNANVLWIHNDSGYPAHLYALDTQGNLLGTCPVVGARARDWEDIAIGPGPDPNQRYLYIGDIGDNESKYPSVWVYRVPEPDVDATNPFGQMRIGPAEPLELTYPDGPRDAETLLVDPLNGDIYIIAKRSFFCRVYRARFPDRPDGPVVLERVAVLPWGFATGGDVSPDGRRVIVRSPFNAALWIRPDGEPLWKAFGGRQIGIPLRMEPQGEAIGFDSRGEGYFTISEGVDPPLYYFALVSRADEELSDNSTSHADPAR